MSHMPKPKLKNIYNNLIYLFSNLGNLSTIPTISLDYVRLKNKKYSIVDKILSNYFKLSGVI